MCVGESTKSIMAAEANTWHPLNLSQKLSTPALGEYLYRHFSFLKSLFKKYILKIYISIDLKVDNCSLDNSSE